jgi:rRNA maturation RNase YbeY
MEAKALISFHYETQFTLPDEMRQQNKILYFLERENKQGGALQYVFMSDEQLHKLNVEYLNHDTYTDIITFDMSEGDEIAGDLYISIERVKDNAEELDTFWEEELDRVMIHGLLHLIGYGDKTKTDQAEMRAKENEYLALFSKLF